MNKTNATDKPKILITGATGLIGTALIEKFRKLDVQLVCQSRTYRPNEPGIKWIQHNLITDSWDCLGPYQIDVAYHLAGQTSVYEAKENPVKDLLANVHSMLNLLEYFRSRQLSPFVVLAGTATEVGLPNNSVINETIPDLPVTFYDLSKLSAELYLKQYVRDGLANGCTLRLGNVFGRREAGGRIDRGILDRVFSWALSGKNIKIYGNGEYLRDYIFIDDVVAAFLAATEHKQQTNGRSFYIGSGKGIYLKDAFLKVASLAAKRSGVDVCCEYVNPPEGLSVIEFRNAVIDSSEFSSATGWHPKYDFQDGIDAAYM